MSSTKVSKGRRAGSKNLEQEQKESSVHVCFVSGSMAVGANERKDFLDCEIVREN
jgi:hypothetical protein